MVVPVFVAFLLAAAVTARLLAMALSVPAEQGRTLAFGLGTRNSFVVPPRPRTARGIRGGSEDEGWVSYRTPAGAVSAGVVAVLVDGGGGEDGGWVVDTMSFGLPASECAAPAGR